MKLIEAVEQLDSLDEDFTIYALEPWISSSEAVVVREPESGDLPVDAKAKGMKYFLEVVIAKEFLEDWLSSLGKRPSPSQKCDRLIQYAINDA